MNITVRLSRRSKYGNYHDLDEYLEDLQEEYFDHKDLGLDITWGRYPRKGSVNVSLGLYHPDRKLIVISPILDFKDIPKYFVNHVIYHEMCHSVVPWEHPYGNPNGPVMLHTPTFREAEARYKYHAKALKWEEDNIHKLFRRLPK
jgi:hypothetical protein